MSGVVSVRFRNRPHTAALDLIEKDGMAAVSTPKIDQQIGYTSGMP